MEIPPLNDPRRPLVLAIRLARMLGFICVIVGVFAAFPLMVKRARAPVHPLEIVIPLGFLSFAAGYFVCRAQLAKRREWALLVGLTLGGVNLLVLLGVIGFLAFKAIVDPYHDKAWMIVPFTILALLAIGPAQLVYLLSRSFSAIHLTDDARGFAPMMSQPVQPLPITPASAAEPHSHP
jgi:hypothetical protein